MKTVTVLLLALCSVASGCQQGAKKQTVDAAMTSGGPGLPVASDFSTRTHCQSPEAPPLVDTPEELDRRLHGDRAVMLNLSSEEDAGVRVIYRDGSTCTIKDVPGSKNVVTLSFSDGGRTTVETIAVDPRLLQQWVVAHLAAGLKRALPPGAQMSVVVGGEEEAISASPNSR